MDIKKVHKHHPIIDGHADTFLHYRERPLDFFSGKDRLHLDHQGLQKAQQNLQIMAIYTPGKHTDLEGLQFALNLLSVYYQALHSKENSLLERPYRGVHTKAHLDKVCKPGNYGFLLFMEGATPLRGNIQNLRIFYELGIRGITLTHNFDNEAAKGCFAEGKNRGLTKFGKELVREMENIGMAVDLAHSNEDTFWDVIRIAKKPVLDSHTGLRTIRDFPRNITDEQVKAIANTGGVVCISFLPDQLKPGIMEEGKAEISDVVRNILHAAEIGGIDHVGLGSDWDGFDGAVSGLEGPDKLPSLTKALFDAGLSEEEAAKVLGGNMYRLLSEVLSMSNEH